MLSEGEANWRRQGIELWLAALNPEVLEVVNNSSLGPTLGVDRLFLNVQGAVGKYERKSN